MLEFSDKKIVGTIQIEKPITESDIEGIIVTSFEGGSNYWMGLDNSTPEWKEKPKGMPLATWATKLILDKKCIKLYDVKEEMDDNNWILTLDKLIEGIKLNAKHRQYDADLENIDAETADCILQYALFRELIFS